jgi:MFS family permease
MVQHVRLFQEVYRPGAKVARFLGVLALSGIAYGLYKGVQDNYLAELVHITPFERGLVEFFRELPGLLVVLILAVMYRFTESRVFKIGTALMAAGLAGLLAAGTGKFIVVLFMVIFSFGEHISMPVKTTITLDLAKRKQAGAALGITTSISQAGQITGYIVVTLLFFIFSRMGFARSDRGQFKIIYAAGTALVTAAALVSLALQETTIKSGRRRFYFARKFFKYYMLEIFYGARKQVFLTFAPYVLIKQYGADTSVVSLLLAVCAGFGVLFGSLTGKFIDRVGYKFVMVTDTLILVGVCFLYGFSHRLFPAHIAFMVVCVNFVLDSIISLASMASNVYVQRIAENSEEVTATLSTGVSVNHFISILIALLGGWIWELAGIEVLFSISAFLGIINSIYAATINVKNEETRP